LFIVESKSIHGTISIDKHEEWRRTYGDKLSGMRSPVIQAQEQGKILKEILLENAEQTLGKMLFGKIQKGYKYCPVSVYVAISDSGIIERGMDVPELLKADAVSGAINSQLEEYARKANIFALQNIFSTDSPWEMTKQEAQATAEFLLSRHAPLQLAKTDNSDVQEAIKKTVNKSDLAFIHKVGASCPMCGKEKLIRKSVNRSDGTETDFLACQGYPNTCKALFPLVALVRKGVSESELKVRKESIVGETNICPKCGVGKKVRKKGTKGKPDFFACSNYGKTKCGFIESINK
jgi:ssDNA-binding Zn-finger/Zn-ribbon topoisomerase 1